MLVLAGAAAAQRGTAPPAGRGTAPLRVYVGTYTSGASRGIYSFDLDGATGRVLSGPVLSAPSRNPSFLVPHPDGRTLYAVNEVADFRGAKTGAVSAFAVDRKTGYLSLLNQQPSEGADPCHLTVDGAGRTLFVANYTGGTVALFPLAPDGRIQPAASVRRFEGSGPNAARQQRPHAHGVFLDSSGLFLLSADLGTDRIHIDRFDGEKGRLEPNDPGGVPLEPGSGPRHLAWHPSGRFAYVLAELFCRVTAFRWDEARGSLAPFQTVAALPEGYSGDNKAAEIGVSPDGRFVYVSNRGDDSLVVLSADGGGRLAFAGRVPSGGRTPRSFAIDPSGRWLIAANQDSGTVVVFHLDPATGLPHATGTTVAVPEPVAILVTPSNGAR